MPITVQVIPGKQFANNETVTTGKLNQLGQPTFSVSGTIGTSEIANDSVTPDKVQQGGYAYATGTVSSDTVLINLTPSMPAGYVTGAVVRWKQVGAPVVAIAKLNVNSRGVRNIVKNVGDATTQPLALGDIRSGGVYEAIYDGAQFQLTSQPATPANLRWSATGTDNYTVTTGFAFGSENQWLNSQIAVTFANANTASVTLLVDGLGPFNVGRDNDQDLSPGDIAAGSTHLLTWTGTKFRIVSALQSVAFPKPVYESAKDLYMRVTSTAPAESDGNPNKITVTASVVVMKDVNDRCFLVRNFSVLNASLANTVGLINGPDVNPAITATWWYVYAASTGTVHGLVFSLNATQPTLPAGYKYFVRLGTFWGNLTGLRSQLQYGNRVSYPDNSLAFFPLLGFSVANTYEVAPASTQPFVPPLARYLFGTAGAHKVGANSYPAVMAISGIGIGGVDQVGAGAVHICIGAQTTLTWPGPDGTTNISAAGHFRIPTRGSTQFQWRSASTAANHFLHIMGYEL